MLRFVFIFFFYLSFFSFADSLVIDGGVGKEKDVYFSWGKQYKLDTSVEGEGHISAVSQWVDAGKSIKIVATPHDGYRLGYWKGDLGGEVQRIDENTLLVTMDIARKVEVIFVRKTDAVFKIFPYHGVTEKSHVGTFYSATIKWKVETPYYHTDKIRYVCLSKPYGQEFILGDDVEVNLKWKKEYKVDVYTVVNGKSFVESHWVDIEKAVGLTSLLKNREGYEFFGWRDARGNFLSSDEKFEIFVDAPGKIYAYYFKDKLTLSINSEHAVSEYGEGEYDPGEEVHWNISPSFVVKGDRRYRAKKPFGFEKIYKDRQINIDWSEEYYVEMKSTGLGFLSNESSWVKKGESYSVKAIPRSGYTFSYWGGDVPKELERSNPLTINVSKPLSVYPVFSGLVDKVKLIEGFSETELKGSVAGNRSTYRVSNEKNNTGKTREVVLLDNAEEIDYKIEKKKKDQKALSFNIQQDVSYKQWKDCLKISNDKIKVIYHPASNNILFFGRNKDDLFTSENNQNFLYEGEIPQSFFYLGGSYLTKILGKKGETIKISTIDGHLELISPYSKEYGIYLRTVLKLKGNQLLIESHYFSSKTFREDFKYALAPNLQLALQVEGLVGARSRFEGFSLPEWRKDRLKNNDYSVYKGDIELRNKEAKYIYDGTESKDWSIGFLSDRLNLNFSNFRILIDYHDISQNKYNFRNYNMLLSRERKEKKSFLQLNIVGRNSFVEKPLGQKLTITLED